MVSQQQQTLKPLVEGMSDGSLQLPVSLRALAAMRLMRIVIANNGAIGHVSVSAENGAVSVDFARRCALPDVALMPPVGSNWRRDYYPLAVMLSYLFIGEHPYRGRLWFEAPLINDRVLKQIYIEHAQFLLATDSNAPNAPVPGQQTNVVNNYKMLPPDLRESLKHAFTDGPVWFPIEPVETEMQHFYKLLWRVFCTTAPKSNLAMEIEVDRYAYYVAPGKQIVTTKNLETIGICKEGEDRAGRRVLQIVNISSEPWQLISTGIFSHERRSIIRPGDYVMAQRGMHFERDAEDVYTLKI